MHVIAGVGIPGSGKTTYLKPLADKLGYTYVNADAIREEVTGDESDHSKEPVIWKMAHERIVNGLRKGGVVVDATYTRRRDRRELIGLCRQAGATMISAYWFKTPICTCMQRNGARQRIVSEEAILKLHNRLNLNPPKVEEGFDEIVEITD